MKIRKNDKVLIIKGKYRGKTGTVIRAIPKESRVIVEGINIVKKHIKPKKSGEKGKIAEIPAPISVSNTKLICKKCKKATRIGYRIETILENGKSKKVKKRICKKCGSET